VFLSEDPPVSDINWESHSFSLRPCVTIGRKLTSGGVHMYIGYPRYATSKANFGSVEQVRHPVLYRVYLNQAIMVYGKAYTISTMSPDRDKETLDIRNFLV
jgi:hypothetical protein